VSWAHDGAHVSAGTTITAPLLRQLARTGRLRTPVLVAARNLGYTEH
jgi:hypothetical protein